MKRNQWEYFGTSVRGPLHVKNGIVNQDSYFHKKYQGMDILVVCDGLGSKKFSQIGSKMGGYAVYKSVQETDFTNLNWEEFINKIYHHWYQLISPLSAMDCASTCLFVISYEDKIF